VVDFGLGRAALRNDVASTTFEKSFTPFVDTLWSITQFSKVEIAVCNCFERRSSAWTNEARHRRSLGGQLGLGFYRSRLQEVE
jgi:hypothetical protein